MLDRFRLIANVPLASFTAGSVFVVTWRAADAIAGDVTCVAAGAALGPVALAPLIGPADLGLLAALAATGAIRAATCRAFARWR